jgi:methylene-tetrahydromethanopterin dehydrogenase
VLAAGAGAEVAIVGHDGSEAASRVASSCKQRYGVDIEALDGSTDERKQALLADVDVVFSTAKAGVQVLSSAQLQSAVALKVAGDLNAVPPLGIEGVDLMDDGASIAGLKQAVGIGALAIGNVKYQVQQQLLKAMATTDTPLYLDFRQAFDRAREYVKAA